MADFLALLELEEAPPADEQHGAMVGALALVAAPGQAPALDDRAQRTTRSLRMHLAKSRHKLFRQQHMTGALVKKLQPKSKRLDLKVRKRKRGQVEVTLQERSRMRAECRSEPSTYIAAAFSTVPGAEHAALHLGVARRTLCRMRFVMAQFVLDFQLFLLRMLVMFATMHQPDICVTREAWDETSQMCVFRLHPGAESSESRSAWGVMVLRVSISLAWVDNRLPPIFYEFVMPPLVLPTTSAANMYYSLRNHPAFVEFSTALQALRARCKMKSCLLESDAAYSNEKLIAYFLNTAPQTDDFLLAWKACHSHKNMHVESMTVSSVDMRLLGKLYSMCAFVQSGTHWARLRAALPSWSRDVAERRIVFGRPSKVAKLLAGSIVAYYEAVDMPMQQRSSAKRQRWQHEVRSVARCARSEAKSAAKHQAFVSNLRKFLQGTYNALDASPTVHMCSGPACCPQGAGGFAKRLEDGLRDLVLRRVPSPPVASKWTKLSPALNAIVFGVLIRLWPTLWPTAYSALSCARRSSGATEQDQDDAQGALDFQALNGARFKKASEFVNNRESCIGVIILAICLEPVRMLTDFFIHCSSDARPHDEPPPVMTLLNPRKSPLVVALQYLASLYFSSMGEDSRLWLLTAWLGFDSAMAHSSGSLGGGAAEHTSSDIYVRLRLQPRFRVRR